MEVVNGELVMSNEEVIGPGDVLGESPIKPDMAGLAAERGVLERMPLSLTMNVYQGKIALGFGQMIPGMVLTPANALALANRLRGMANQIQHDAHQAAAKAKRKR